MAISHFYCVLLLSCKLSDIFLLHIFHGRCEMYVPYILYMLLLGAGRGRVPPHESYPILCVSTESIGMAYLALGASIKYIGEGEEVM